MSKSMVDRLDHELMRPIKMMLSQPGGVIDLHDIPAARVGMEQMMAAMQDQMPVIEGVTVEDRMVPGPAGAPDVAVRISRPEGKTGKLPALLWIHGGGYIMGSIENEDVSGKQLALAGECVIVSVEYRLAPEHPFPAPLGDCYAALKWLASRTSELNADPKRIAIGGGSAGGGLAAGLALLTRDRAEVAIIFQLLVYPMIDDRNVVPACDTLPDTILWTRESNLIGWSSYLGCEPGGEGVSCYAAASRADDLSGLAPAYITVGELDLFVQEDIDYAQCLIAAGVPTELHVYPGGCHAFDGLVPDADVARRFTADIHRALKRALHG
jgi:acetyl esterase/lipase